MYYSQNKLVKAVRLATLGLAITAITFNASTLFAATGNDLLVSSLSASDANKNVIGSKALLAAVYDAVSKNKSQAPEIVAAAIPKTSSVATQKEIIRTAIAALGDPKSAPKGTVANIVAAAIKAAPKGGFSDGKSGYSKDSGDCGLAEDFTQAAIEALGPNVSERLVNEIVEAAILANNGKCSDRIANGATQAAPQFADSIADISSRASRGETLAFDGSGSEIVFSPTGRPVPSPFNVPPATNGGISPETTPVN